MKAEIKTKEESFKPQELVITIETKEEYDMLKSIFGLNITIPSQYNGDRKNLSCQLLDKIHKLFK